MKLLLASHFILSRVLCLPDILYNNVQFLIYRYDPSYIIKKAPRRGLSYILLDSEMKAVSKLSVLLTTAYGLSVSKNDEDVKLKSYSSLFAHLPKKHERTIEEISKDQC